MARSFDWCAPPGEHLFPWDVLLEASPGDEVRCWCGERAWPWDWERVEARTLALLRLGPAVGSHLRER